MFDTDDSMDDADAAETYQMIHYIRVPTLAELGQRRSDYAVVPPSPSPVTQESPRGRRVLRILQEVTRDGGLWYKTLFVDRHIELVSGWLHCGLGLTVDCADGCVGAGVVYRAD